MGYVISVHVRMAGFSVWGFGCRVEGLGLKLQGAGFGFWGLEFMVQGLGLWIQDLELRV